MKNEKLNQNKIINKNVIKKSKIIDGIKCYELDINSDNYNLKITNLPNENLIKFKLYIDNINQDNKELKSNPDIYGNEFNLEYFLNQTPFLSDLGIKNINELIRFLHTYFQEYNNNKMINYDNNNPDIITINLHLFNNKIQINIELPKEQINLKEENINNNKYFQLRTVNSCKNLTVNKKLLRNHDPKIRNIINDSNSLIMDYYISLIQKKIPLLKKLTKDKLILIYKSSEDKENSDFHSKCDDKGPTLVFIDTEENRSFIAFNKKSWHSVSETEIGKVSWKKSNIRDDDITILDLFSKKIIEIKKKKEEIEKNSKMKFIIQYSNYGPSYMDGNGITFKIFGKDKYLNISFIYKSKEEEDFIQNNFKLNQNNFLHVKDYEVYTFKNHNKK